MEDRIKAAFNAVRADPALKEAALSAVSARRPRHTVRRLVPALVCVLILALGLGGCGLYFTPTASITLQMDPGVELRLNRFDKVLKATGVNADGQALLAGMDLRFQDYRDALDQLLAAGPVAQLLAEDQAAYISVDCADQGRRQALLQNAEACAARHGNVNHDDSGHHGYGGGNAVTATVDDPSATAAPVTSTPGHHGYGNGGGNGHGAHHD